MIVQKSLRNQVLSIFSERAAGKIFLAAFFFFMAILPAFSQVSSGRIWGGVKDQSGGAIAGATVTVTDPARNVSRNLTTDEAGEFNAPNLLPGAYDVRSEFK